jgi:hypothetical protein
LKDSTPGIISVTDTASVNAEATLPAVRLQSVVIMDL